MFMHHQVVSVRNISQSSSKSHTSTGEEQSHGRLLRIALTDGHSVVSALEYHAMPKFSLTTTPGTKVINSCPNSPQLQLLDIFTSGNLLTFAWF